MTWQNISKKTKILIKFTQENKAKSQIENRETKRVRENMWYGYYLTKKIKTTTINEHARSIFLYDKQKYHARKFDYSCLIWNSLESFYIGLVCQRVLL